MIKPQVKLLLGTSLFLVISGCSWLVGDEGLVRDKEYDYLDSELAAPTKVPEHLDDSAIGDLLPVPEIENTGVVVGEDADIPRPQPLAANAGEETVKIQKFANRRWILIDAGPSEVWPKTREFLLRNRFLIAEQDGLNGTLITQWKKDSATDLNHQYRIRLEQGVRRNTTEIHVVERSLAANSVPAQYAPAWNDSSMNSQQEDVLVDDLSVYLASVDISRAPVSLMAQSISTENRIRLSRNALGLPQMLLRLDFNRAWVTIGKALEKAGIQVDDLNRSESKYYISYALGQSLGVSEEESGFFGDLFGSDEVLDTTTYQVRVDKRDQGAVSVHIENADGNNAPLEVSEQLLAVLQEYMG